MAINREEVVEFLGGLTILENSTTSSLFIAILSLPSR